jgi:hypothetical protein
MNYTGTYNDYRTLWIWKDIEDKFYHETNYLLMAKIYTMPECHRVVVTKNNVNDYVSGLKLYNKKTNVLQHTLIKNPNSRNVIVYDFKNALHKQILTNFFFVKKLNSKNVEKFLFAELI